MVIDLAAVMKHCVDQRTPTHSRQRTNLNIVTYHDRADMGQADGLTLRISLEPEPIFTNYGARLNDTPRTNHHFVADNDIVMDHRFSPDPNPSPQYNVPPYASRWVDNRFILRPNESRHGFKQSQCASEIQSWLQRDKGWAGSIYDTISGAQKDG